MVRMNGHAVGVHVSGSFSSQCISGVDVLLSYVACVNLSAKGSDYFQTLWSSE